MGVKWSIKRKAVPGQSIEDLQKRSKDGFVKIGVLAGTGEHPEATKGQLIAEIAWWNEFGTKRIPARPFLRPGLRRNLITYRMILKNGLPKVLRGEWTRKQLLGMLGIAAKGDVQQMIVDVKTPPNAPSTIKKKGRDNPLIWHGIMRGSIDWAILKSGERRRKRAMRI